MSKVMPEVIHESQTAYIPGRYVHDNLKSLNLIKQYCKTEKIKGLMIGVDARKAFDSVDHNYMQGVLEACGFGPKCKTFKDTAFRASQYKMLHKLILRNYYRFVD
jgi:hypothetical protein